MIKIIKPKKTQYYSKVRNLIDVPPCKDCTIDNKPISNEIPKEIVNNIKPVGTAIKLPKNKWQYKGTTYENFTHLLVNIPRQFIRLDTNG